MTPRHPTTAQPADAPWSPLPDPKGCLLALRDTVVARNTVGGARLNAYFARAARDSVLRDIMVVRALCQKDLRAVLPGIAENETLEGPALELFIEHCLRTSGGDPNSPPVATPSRKALEVLARRGLLSAAYEVVRRVAKEILRTTRGSEAAVETIFLIPDLGAELLATAAFECVPAGSPALGRVLVHPAADEMTWRAAASALRMAMDNRWQAEDARRAFVAFAERPHILKDGLVRRSLRACPPLSPAAVVLVQHLPPASFARGFRALPAGIDAPGPEASPGYGHHYLLDVASEQQLATLQPSDLAVMLESGDPRLRELTILRIAQLWPSVSDR